MKNITIHILHLVLIFTLTSPLVAQEMSDLSDAGYAHWIAANRLLDNAGSPEEFELVATELESVIETDPQFKDTYMKLVHVYEKIAIKRGEPVFVKAEQLLNNYLERFPDEKREIGAERIYIDALREKYKQNIPMGFVGKWGADRWGWLEISCTNGHFTATTNSYRDKYEYEVKSIRQVGNHLILKIKETYDGIATGKLKYDRSFKKYIPHVHRCNGIDYLWTKEIETITYKIYNKNGTNYMGMIGMHKELYSQGTFVHSCSSNYKDPIFVEELSKW